MKIGDEIVITSDIDEPFFYKGDRAIIKEIKCDGLAWADFNNKGNKKVYGRGFWCVGHDGIYRVDEIDKLRFEVL